LISHLLCPHKKNIFLGNTMLIHPLPDPVIFHIAGPISLRWYGVMYLVAFAQFLFLGRIRVGQPHIKAAGWTTSDLDDMLFYGVLGVVIGGRLGEVFLYRPAYFYNHPLEILELWTGGMSFYGGFLGVVVAMTLWAKKRQFRLMEVLDFIAPLVPLGYAAGRIGNFINGELWGRVADASLPWAMIWPNVDALPRHPSPIYQALVDGVLVFVIMWFFARKQRPMMAVSGLFAVLYGCARFFTEYFRTPEFEVHVFGATFSGSQIYSIPMVLLGITLLILAYTRDKKLGVPSLRY
jgi:phosphatidylglycerol---prolipoprotein diacylglyceryl transferase